ncbi:MAG: DUF3017 domain-containing protein [Propionibacteriaceae bacterium]
MAAADSPPAPPTRGTSNPTQWPLLIIVAGVVVGLGIAVLGEWRMGALVIGTSLTIGAVERTLLTRRAAGMLQVRSKAFDVILLLAMGVGIIVLAILVPDHRR